MKEKEYYLNLPREIALSILRKQRADEIQNELENDIYHFNNYIEICKCFIQQLRHKVEEHLVKQLKKYGEELASSYSLEELSRNDKIENKNYYFSLSITSNYYNTVRIEDKDKLLIPYDMLIVSEVLRDLFACFKVNINPIISTDRRNLQIMTYFTIDEYCNILNGIDNALENLISGAYQEFEYLYNNQLPHERTR